MLVSRTRKNVLSVAAIGVVAIGGAGSWAAFGGSDPSAASAPGSLTAASAPGSTSAEPGAKPAAPGATSAAPGAKPGAEPGAAAPKGRTAAAGAAAPATVAATRLGPPLNGTFTLWVASPQADPCIAQAGAPDIHIGAPVTVRTTAGATIASTILAKGRADATHRGCVYPFTVTPIAADATFTVTVGTRSGLAYTPKDVAASNGRLILNLGLAR